MPVLLENKHTISRCEELAPPTIIDIRETKTLLQDFRIKADIPHFGTLQELIKWRVQLIRKQVARF